MTFWEDFLRLRPYIVEFLWLAGMFVSIPASLLFQKTFDSDK